MINPPRGRVSQASDGGGRRATAFLARRRDGQALSVPCSSEPPDLGEPPYLARGGQYEHAAP